MEAERGLVADVPPGAARWIAQGMAAAGLDAVATGTGVKGPGSHSLRHRCVRHWL